MPEPNAGETREDWMQRCESDPEQRKTFPDASQRTAVCEAKYDDKNKKKNRMKSTPNWLRANIVSRPIGVDRTKNVLQGYVVAQEGPFKSDGRGEFDKQSLQMLVDMHKSKPGGLKSRFTHPDMSNDGLGKFLGRSRDPWMDYALDARTGKKVSAIRANLHFDKTAMEPPPEGNGSMPLGVYVMNLSESDPDALSSSIVVKADEEYRHNEDGSLTKDDDGNALPPLWRPTELHASDIVDTGDAVDGLLSAQLDVERLPLSVLWKGERLLDAVFNGEPRDVIEARLSAYIQRYLSRKFGEPVPVVSPTLDARKIKLDEMRVLIAKSKNG